MNRMEASFPVPIYEYECNKCGKIFEAFQKITDKPLTKCKFCEGKAEKIISHSSFQLKGSGWYLTDYAHRSTSPANDTGDAGGATKGDSSEKSAPTSEAKSDSATKSSEKPAAVASTA